LQAEALGLLLRNCPIDLIATSASVDAAVTAHRIAHWHRKARRAYDLELDEIDLGDLHGGYKNESGDSRKRAYDKLVSAWSEGDLRKRAPDGESMEKFSMRVTKAMVHMGFGAFAKYPGKHMVIVGHEFVNKIILSEFAYMETHVRLVDQPCGCITVFDFCRNGTAKVLTPVMTSHLDLERIPKNRTLHHKLTCRDAQNHRNLLEDPENYVGVLEKFNDLQLQRDRGELSKREFRSMRRELCASSVSWT